MSCQQKNFLADHRGWRGGSCQSWAEPWSCGWQVLRLLGQRSRAVPTVPVLLLECQCWLGKEAGLPQPCTSTLKAPKAPTLNTPWPPALWRFDSCQDISRHFSLSWGTSVAQTPPPASLQQHLTSICITHKQQKQTWRWTLWKRLAQLFSTGRINHK